MSFSVPDDWTAGRIWGRTECDFSTVVGPNFGCATGGCIGGLECATTGGTVSGIISHFTPVSRRLIALRGMQGVPPATVAEWTLDSGGTDYYDGE